MSPHRSPNLFPLVKNSGPPPPDYSSCRPIEYLGQNFRGYTAHDQHQGRHYWLVYLQDNLGGEPHDVRLRTMTPVDESRRVDNSSTLADESTTPVHAHTSSTTRVQANNMMTSRRLPRMHMPHRLARMHTPHDSHAGELHDVRLHAMTPVLSAQASGRLVDDSLAGKLHDVRLRTMTPVLSAQASTHLVDNSRAGELHDVRLRTMMHVLSAQASRCLVDDSRTGELSCSSPVLSAQVSTRLVDNSRAGTSSMTPAQVNYHVVRLRAMTPMLSAQASTHLVDDSRAGELHDVRLRVIVHDVRLRMMTPVLSAQRAHASSMSEFACTSSPARDDIMSSLSARACTHLVEDSRTACMGCAYVSTNGSCQGKSSWTQRGKCLQAFDTHTNALAMWAKVCHSVHRRCKSHNACEGHGCDLKADHLQCATEAAAVATRVALNASRAADALTSAVQASSHSTTSASARSAATTPDPPRPPALIQGSHLGTVCRGKWMSKYPPRGRMTPLPTPDPERERNPLPHPPLYDDDSDDDTTTLPTPLAGSTTIPTARSAFTTPAMPGNTTIKREKSVATVSLWADGDDTKCEGAGSDDAAMVMNSSPRSPPPPSTMSSISTSSSLSFVHFLGFSAPGCFDFLCSSGSI
ncbi:hypothetical protein B0H14DRAFT_3497051 [Mycena olivaceomarginata]|nr:hypothetical protein B0H14DRAFT_3497051 [Mycena olivaceomarginata]